MEKSSPLAIRGGSKTAATSKVEHFMIIVNGFQPLTIITKSSTLDVTAVLDPPLVLSVDSTYIYTCLVWVSANSNVLNELQSMRPSGLQLY